MTYPTPRHAWQTLDEESQGSPWIEFLAKQAALTKTLVRLKRLQVTVLLVNLLVLAMQLVNMSWTWKILRILRPGWLPWQ